MARFAATRSTISESSRTTKPTNGVSSAANVPTLKGSTDSEAWANRLLAERASASPSVREARVFLIIFLSRAGH